MLFLLLTSLQPHLHSWFASLITVISTDSTWLYDTVALRGTSCTVYTVLSD